MGLQETLEEVSVALRSVPKSWQEASPGEQLRALRRSRRVSQRHLADESGVDQADISRLEHGADARLSTWKKLFLALGYGAVLLPLFSCEDTADWLEVGTMQRNERMEAGRTRRR